MNNNDNSLADLQVIIFIKLRDFELFFFRYSCDYFQKNMLAFKLVGILFVLNYAYAEKVIFILN